MQDFGFVKTTTTANTKTNLTTGYLNIPLLAKYYATEKLFFVFGPQFGVLLNAKSKSSGTETLTTTFDDDSTSFETEDLSSPSQDTKDGFNTLNIAMVLVVDTFLLKIFLQKLDIIMV